MNVQVSGVAEELIQQMINSGEVSTAEEAVELLAQRYLCGEETKFSPNDPRVDVLIQQGKDSGIGSEVTPEYWANLKQHLEANISERNDVRRGA